MERMQDSACDILLYDLSYTSVYIWYGHDGLPIVDSVSCHVGSLISD